MRRKIVTLRPEVIEYIKKILFGTAKDQDFFKLSPDTNTVKGIEKTFREIRSVIKYLGATVAANAEAKAINAAA